MNWLNSQVAGQHSSSSTGSGNRKPRFASWICHLLPVWSWTCFWPFFALFSSPRDEVGVLTTWTWYSEVSYCNWRRLPTAVCFLFSAASVIPCPLVHSSLHMLGSSLEKESLRSLHPPQFWPYSFFSHLHQNFRKELYICSLIPSSQTCVSTTQMKLLSKSPRDCHLV